MERREFLHSMERFAAAALCAWWPAAALGCASYRYVPAVVERHRLVVRRSDVGMASYALIEHPSLSRAVFLHRQPDGNHAAVLTRCTHRGCQVEPAGDRLACPCHGSEYRFTGEVLQGPAERPLQRYEVTADAVHIYIHLTDAP